MGGTDAAPQTLSKVHSLMNSSLNAPWKDGRERSDRWKETLCKGFLPRVSDSFPRAFHRNRDASDDDLLDLDRKAEPDGILAGQDFYGAGLAADIDHHRIADRLERKVPLEDLENG